MITVICNGQPYSVPRHTTVHAFIERLALTEKRIAVEMNQCIIPKSAYADTLIKAGDHIEIVQAIGGG